MTTAHGTGTREQWLAARLELLEAEKELTRRGDELARRRQELPWVRVDKEYRFETEDGAGVAGRPLRRALAAARLPLHVRSRVHRRVPVVLGDRGRLQRLGRPPGAPRRGVRRGLARADRRARGLQAPDGLDASPGRPPAAATSTSTSHVGHRGAAALGQRRVQLPPGRPAWLRDRPQRHASPRASRRWRAWTWRRTCAKSPG